jgi:poly(3-hydroxybutyrate) depolymerase
LFRNPIAAIVFCLLATAASASEPTVEWLFENWQGAAIPVRMFVPAEEAANAKIVIVMHGASRDATRYFSDWKTLGEEHNLVVVVPEFTKKNFNRSARYNMGFVLDPASGKQREEAQWTFSAIEPLFDEVVQRIGGEQQRYTIYGHSAGSQFVHRFMYFKPDARVDNYIAANAGWYTLPVEDFAFPYGLRSSGIDTAEVPRILAQPLTLLLGRDDDDPESPKLRKTREANQQGPHRLARGLTMYRVAKARAEELGVPFNWKLIVVKDADHDNAKMAPVAAGLIGN